MKQYSSEAEMIQLTLEENQSRCDFFKHFQYSTKEKLGTVSIQTNDQTNKLTKMHLVYAIIVVEFVHRGAPPTYICASPCPRISSL